VIGYDTRFDLKLPDRTGADAVASFFRGNQQPEWLLVEELDGPVLNFRWGRLSFRSTSRTGMSTCSPGSREPGRSLATTATGWFTSRSSLPDVRGFPTSSRATTFLEQLARRALAVVEGGWHLAEDFSRIGEQVSGIEAKRPCYLTLCL
jgi:hypothetical protein